MPYAFEGGMPSYLDMLKRRLQPGLPMGGMPFEGNYSPYGGKGSPQFGGPSGINPVPQQPIMGGMPGMGGSGPMGFPNPLAQFRPYMSGSNPMGRRKMGMGLIRQY